MIYSYAFCLGPGLLFSKFRTLAILLRSAQKIAHYAQCYTQYYAHA